jgi:hypothetical protein
MSSKQGTSAFVHPGNRRQANKPYSPPANQFSNGQATSHFVSYGGGNALVLKQGGVAQPQIGATAATLGKQPEYIQVTLPAGVSSGQTIQVYSRICRHVNSNSSTSSTGSTTTITTKQQL